MSDTNINIQGSPNAAVNFIISKSFKYNDLLDQQSTLQKLFDRTPEEETKERLEISEKLNLSADLIEQFNRDVLTLAETFDKIEINTDRLKQAKEFFDQGDIGEARALLNDDNEKINSEEEILWAKREFYKNEIEPKLIEKAEERLIQALLNKSDYTNPDWFADTCRYFERSIESFPNKENVFQYAVFLQEHNQREEAEKYYSQYLNDFSSQISKADYAASLNNLAILHKAQNNYDEALKEYEEALAIRRKLAETNPNTYLPDVAMTLNNLANLHSAQNNYDEALKEYEEALAIRRKLAETNPNTYLPYVATSLNNLAILHSDQNNYDEALKEYEEALAIYRKLAETNPNTYLPYVATSLNNLAILHSAQNNYDEALKEYEEALAIRRKLAETNPNTYLPYVATSLNNLAILHKAQNNYDEALKEYEEALAIYRKLAETNPNTYLPYVATSLNNLAILHKAQNNYDEALKEYEEALAIYRKLAETNPNTYLPDVAMTLINFSVYYQDAVAQREKSIEYVIEAMLIILPIVERVPYTKRYMQTAMLVLKDWNLSDEEISQMIEEKMKENEFNDS